jgi:hypothetical protein
MTATESNLRYQDLLKSIFLGNVNILNSFYPKTEFGLEWLSKIDNEIVIKLLTQTIGLFNNMNRELKIELSRDLHNIIHKFAGIDMVNNIINKLRLVKK